MAAVSNADSPKSPELDKNKKYDRQLRLWGDHGQTALEASQVCLINASATGTEILKSLVLPGIGAFTVVDGHKISGEDVGNNFFLTKESIGKSRAQVATELLLELNSDVRGDWVDETPQHLLENNPNFFNHFSVVIATNLHEKILLELASRLWDVNVPLLICRSYGLIGYMRLVVKEHTVIESHPDNSHADLRLDYPFLTLEEYAKSMDLTKMNKKDHSHTPYLIILLKCLKEWKITHNNEIPKTYKEKEAFRDLIRKGILINGKLTEEEENFEEAIRSVNTALIPTEIPTNVKALFKDDACIHLTADSKPFWILAKAVCDFVENEGNGLLPLRGTIPDMTADSDRYIQLQNIYKYQANKDCEVVTKRVRQLLHTLGKPQDCISDADVKLFCKNAAFLKVVRCRSLAEEYDPKTIHLSEIMQNFEDPDSEIVFYILLRAVDRFYGDFNRYPGYYNDQVEPDIMKLKTCLGRILQEWGCGPLMKDDYVHEMCRYGGAELHSVAAFIGGAAAQEAIKLVTNQFIPFNNTYIYNAMSATSAIFDL